MYLQLVLLELRILKKTKLLSKDALENELGFKLDLPYCVITFHPVTLEKNTAQEQVRQLLLACDRMPEYKFYIHESKCRL